MKQRQTDRGNQTLHFLTHFIGIVSSTTAGYTNKFRNDLWSNLLQHVCTVIYVSTYNIVLTVIYDPPPSKLHHVCTVIYGPAYYIMYAL